MLSEVNQPFEFYEAELRRSLNRTIENCLDICSLTRRAHDRLNRSEFQRLCDHLGVTYPTATKWVKIDKSNRIRAYGPKLKLEGWSPLFEIVKLPGDEWQKLVKEKIADTEGPVALTRNQIAAYRKSLARPGERRITLDQGEATALRISLDSKAHIKSTSLISVELVPPNVISKSEGQVLLDVKEHLKKKLDPSRFVVTISDELSSQELTLGELPETPAHDTSFH